MQNIRKKQVISLFHRRVNAGDKTLKVNIFDMAGHPYFYEVCFFFVFIQL